jgi:hypothetical protein
VRFLYCDTRFQPWSEVGSGWGVIPRQKELSLCHFGAFLPSRVYSLHMCVCPSSGASVDACELRDAVFEDVKCQRENAKLYEKLWWCFPPDDKHAVGDTVAWLWIRGFCLFGRWPAWSEFWPTFSTSWLFLSHSSSYNPILFCDTLWPSYRCEQFFLTKELKDYMGIHARVVWCLLLSSRTKYDERCCAQVSW